MPLAKLLKYSILLPERVTIPILRIVEYKSSLVKDGYLVCVFELSALVPSNNSLIDKRAITREILHNRDSLSIFAFVEYETMTIRDSGQLKNPICELSVAKLNNTMQSSYRTLGDALQGSHRLEIPEPF